MKIDPEKIKVKRWNFCPVCKGGGMVHKKCPECEGRSYSSLNVSCSRCNNMGEITERCSACDGKGTAVEEILLSEIPERVRPGYVEAQRDSIKEQMKKK